MVCVGTVRTRSGFTLLELLLATLISTILAGATYTLLAGTGKSRREARTRAEREGLVDRVLDQIGRDLAGSIASGKVYDPGFTGTDAIEDGYDRDTIRFLTVAGRSRLRSDRPAPDLREVSYEYRTGEEFDAEEETEPGLYRIEVKWLASAALDEEERYESWQVSDEVLGLGFRYYDGTAWQDSWDAESNEGLPRAIEVTIRLRPEVRARETEEEAFDREEEDGPPLYRMIVPLRIRREMDGGESS